MRYILLPVVLALLVPSSVASGQDSKVPTGTVTMSNGSQQRISELQVNIFSGAGYIFGGNRGSVDRLLVTPAIVLPEGIEPNPTPIMLNTIARLEFLASQASDRSSRRVKVFLKDGTEREVFLMRPGNSGKFSPMAYSDLTLIGKVVVGQQSVDVTVPSDKIKLVAFE